MQYKLIRNSYRSLRTFSCGDLFVWNNQVGIVSDEGAVLLDDGSRLDMATIVKPCRQVDSFQFEEV